MKPYSPAPNKGRTIAMEVMNCRNSTHPANLDAAAKAMRHAARRQARSQILEALEA